MARVDRPAIRQEPGWRSDASGQDKYRIPLVVDRSMRINLKNGTDEADEALKADPASVEDLILKGQIHEVRAWLLDEPDTFKKAVEAYTKPHQADAKNPFYLLCRGRYFYKWTLGNNLQNL